MKMACPRVTLSALSVIALFTLASCSRPGFNTGGGDRVLVGSNPLTKGNKAAGELQPFTPADKDLAALLSGHPPPKVWLVMPPSTGQAGSPGASTGGPEPATVRVYLPPEAMPVLSALWKSSLTCRYLMEIEGAKDRQSYMNLMIEINNATVAAENELLKIQMDAPGGRRAISAEEAGELVTFINASASTIIEQAKEYKKRRKNAT